MRETYITEQDKKFMKLRDFILNIFPVPPEGEGRLKKKNQIRKEWKSFCRYMDVYYKEVKSMRN